MRYEFLQKPDFGMVRIAPRWTGPQPPSPELRILSARGVDLKPFDAGDPETVDRLMSFVWADDTPRSARLARALDAPGSTAATRSAG